MAELNWSIIVAETEDQELQTMSGLISVMSCNELTAEQHQRIAQWFHERYGSDHTKESVKNADEYLAGR